MLVLTVKTGQAVQLGDVAVIKVHHKEGNRVRLAFHTTLAPIRLLANGIVPTRFTTGITGEQRLAPAVAAA